MVQGKFKAKKSLPSNVKAKSEHRVKKAIEKKNEKSKVNKQKKTIKNVIKGNFENEVKKTGVPFDRKKMHLAEPLKTLGTFEIPVKLMPGVTATLKVEVTKK